MLAGNRARRADVAHRKRSGNWEIEAEVWLPKDPSAAPEEVRSRGELRIAEANEFDMPAIIAREPEPLRPHQGQRHDTRLARWNR